MKYHVTIYANAESNQGQEDYFQEFRATSAEYPNALVASHFTECRKFNAIDTKLPYKMVISVPFVEAETGYQATQRVMEWQKFGYDYDWLTRPTAPNTTDGKEKTK